MVKKNILSDEAVLQEEHDALQAKIPAGLKQPNNMNSGGIPTKPDNEIGE